MDSLTMAAPPPAATTTPAPPLPASLEEISASWSILILISILFAILLTSYFLQRQNIRFIHETVVSILLGSIAGALIRFLPVTDGIQRMVTFDHRYFFNLLLPPIILNSGYDMKRRNFFKNFGSILTFAFIGTFVSTVIIGILIYFFVAIGLAGVQMPLLDCFVFGAILSSTDPVTILSIFHQLKVEPKLYAIIFGESILNDSVAIVLFGTLGKFQGKVFTIQSLIQGINSFLGVFFGSVLIGVILALLCALMLKHSHLHEYPSLESCLVSLLAYSSYLLSNAIQLSGIVSLLFCGITLKHYAYDNMSTRSRRTTKYMFRVLSQMSENFVFIYLGITLFTKTDEVFYPALIIYILIVMMAARYVSTIPLAGVINFVAAKWEDAKAMQLRQRILARRRHSDAETSSPESAGAINMHFTGAYGFGRTTNTTPHLVVAPLRPPKIPRNHQLMLWWAGLRGAIAFALAYDVEGASGPAIRTTTLVVCVVSIVVLGGTTHIAIERLGIRTGVSMSRRHASASAASNISNVSGVVSHTGLVVGVDDVHTDTGFDADESDSSLDDELDHRRFPQQQFGLFDDHGYDDDDDDYTDDGENHDGDDEDNAHVDGDHVVWDAQPTDPSISVTIPGSGSGVASSSATTTTTAAAVAAEPSIPSRQPTPYRTPMNQHSASRPLSRQCKSMQATGRAYTGTHIDIDDGDNGDDDDMEHWFLSFDKRWLKPLFTQSGWGRRGGHRHRRQVPISPGTGGGVTSSRQR